MTQTFQLDHPLQRIVSRFKCAIESESYADALPLLQQYSACLADLLNGNEERCEAPPKEEVIELLTWASRMLIVAHAHSLAQYQLLSDCRLYASHDPSGNTWQVML